MTKGPDGLGTDRVWAEGRARASYGLWTPSRGAVVFGPAGPVAGSGGSGTGLGVHGGDGTARRLGMSCTGVARPGKLLPEATRTVPPAWH